MNHATRVHVSEGARQLVGDGLALDGRRDAPGPHGLREVECHQRAEQVQIRRQEREVRTEERK